MVTARARRLPALIEPVSRDALANSSCTRPLSRSVSAGADPRWVWDDEADPLVASLIDRGDVPAVNALLRTWTKNGQPLPDGLPADLRDFMESARQLPPWTDQAKLAKAQAPSGSP